MRFIVSIYCEFRKIPHIIKFTNSNILLVNFLLIISLDSLQSFNNHSDLT